ncbi:MAG: XRE family transcriptional regulator [Planctomycetota bacterium]|nr:MAG: XRE family transcriptional regulator [Planctomycetota bacterium]
MARQLFLGNRIRRLRRREKLTQTQLAERLGISTSYLNLIENNKRSLTAPLLVKLAKDFQLDLQGISEDDETRLAADLEEVFADHVFANTELGQEELRELALNAPNAAKAFLKLYRAFRATREDHQTLAARVEDGADLSGFDALRLPSQEVSDLIQMHNNHFPSLESHAETLWQRGNLQRHELGQSLQNYLRRELDVRTEFITSAKTEGSVRRFFPSERRLLISEVLPIPSATFQLAHQIGLLELDAELDRLSSWHGLTTPQSKSLAKIALANYFASAVLMPYGEFLEAAKFNRYDVEILEHRFQTTFEQVCHRLTSLSRPENPGVPFHMMRIDIAGNISKHFSGSGIRFARYSGACPRWNVFSAFTTPGIIRTQLSRMPDGATFFCIARTVRKAGGGFRVPQNRLAIGLGCDVKFARELVYADGYNLDRNEAAVPVGVSCRLCDRMNCRQRAFPPAQHGLQVDPNQRGLSFYYSPPPP